MKVLPWLITLLFTLPSFYSGHINAQTISNGSKTSKQKRQRKKASRQAASFADQWQGATTPNEENASEAIPEAQAFGEAAAPEVSNESSMTSNEEAVVDTSATTSIYTLEEQRKLKLIELKQARKKLDKKANSYERELAKIDLQERYWDAEDIREPVAEDKMIFTFHTPQGPKMITYDENGDWLSTISLLNHNQVPVGARRLAKTLEMDITQFEDKFCFEMRELKRPVFALYTSQKGLVLDTILQDNDGMLNQNLVVGLEVFGHGKHFTHGKQIQSLSPDDVGFLAMVITADGNAVAERDVMKLLEAQLFLYPQHFKNTRSSWTPPVGWSAGKDWFALPDWEPEYNRWYPTQDWYVDTDW